jgi:chromosome partitioning protein
MSSGTKLKKSHNSSVPIWCVVNQKGGVGKTTTAVNVAAGLAQKGKRTLLIDCDPQGNATTGFGIDKNTLELSLFDCIANLVDDPETKDALKSTVVQVSDHLHIVPATLDLAGAEPTLMNAVGKELILRDALSQVQDDYDWVILDAPPSLGLLTINILAAADAVLVPMQCEFYALEGLTQLMKTIEIVRKRLNPHLIISKVLLTMYDPRNRLTDQVASEIKAFFGDKVAAVAIPRNIRLSEAPGFGEPAITYFPSSKGAVAYQQLVEEMIR